MKTVMKNASILSVIFVLTLGMATVRAQKGFYFGTGLGPSYINTSIMDVDFSEISFTGNDLSYKFFAGYKLPAFLALEAGYRNLGKISDDIAEQNNAGWDVNAKANITLGPLQIFGKAGAYFNNVKVTFKDPLKPDINSNNTKFMFGFGAGLNIQRLGLRAEWESLDLSSNNKVSMLTAGVTYRLTGGNK